MTESNQNSTVLVVTQDIELLSALLENNTTKFQFISRESIQTVLDDPDLLINNHIIIIDVDSVNAGNSEVIEQTLKLKKSDPTQVIMMVGKAEPLADLLRSNIQPIIYRAFNKPIHPNQIFLSFGSASKMHESLIEKQAAGEDLLAVGPLENKTNIDTLAAQQKNNPAIYAAVGVLALAVIGWLLFGKNSDTSEQADSPVVTEPTIIDDTLLTTNDDVSKINQLNQDAAKALLEGRKISPEGNNALHYYDQVLIIDPYDLTAYEGKKLLVSELKSTYASLVENAEFGRALETINAIQVIEPLDTSSYELREELELAINAHVNELKRSGTAQEIDQTAAVLANIGPESKTSQTAAAALRNEKVLLENIDRALAQNNLIPPTTGNAYAIVSEALQKNTISNVNFSPRINTLSEKLIASANSAIKEDNLEDAEKLTALVKRLDVDPQKFALLSTAIEERKTAIAAEVSKATAEKVAIVKEITKPVSVKIIPAKVISRNPPRYPTRALERNLEGWVSISFTIDTDGVPKDITIIDSEPSNIFDNAAITSVETWRFSPAMNEATKQPVESSIDATKLQFKID